MKPPRHQFREANAPDGESREQYLSVTLLDLAVILFNLHRAVLEEDIGHQDCERTLNKLTEDLFPRRVSIPFQPLESGIWASNMLNEKGKFWSPIRTSLGKKEDFDKFMIRLLRYATKDQCLVFDKDYNQIRKQLRGRRKA